MKGTYKGYDPELGKTFASESSGFVIGRAPSSQKKFEPDYPPGILDEQQIFDAEDEARRKNLAASSSAESDPAGLMRPAADAIEAWLVKTFPAPAKPTE